MKKEEIAKPREFTIKDFDFTPLYYNGPQQIKFFDFVENRYVGGIANKAIIIDGRNGSEIKIDELIKEAERNNFDKDSVIIELSWVPIDGYIYNNKITSFMDGYTVESIDW